MRPAPRVVYAQPGGSAHLSSPAARPPGRWSSDQDEAFYPEERGTQFPWPRKRNNPHPLYKNKFEAQSWTELWDNPLLDPALARSPVLGTTELDDLRPKIDPRYPNASREPVYPREYRAFVPTANGKVKADVTLYFSAGNEMMRHGLRTFFDGSKTKVLVQVPGIEPNKKRLNRAWAVGVTNGMIQRLLLKLGVIHFGIKRIVCYSTGYRGFNESIEQLAANPKDRSAKNSLDLTHVDTAVIFDALYVGNDTVNKLTTHTEVALKSLRKLSPKVRLVVYGATPDGTPRTGGDTAVPQAALKRVFGSDYTFVDLAKPELFKVHLAVAYARLFQSAIQDGYYKLADFHAHVQTLIGALPKRGDLTSAVDPAFRAFPGKTSLASFGKTYQAEIATVLKQSEALNRKVVADSLLGWNAPPGGVAHDTLLSEYGHEFLLG